MTDAAPPGPSPSSSTGLDPRLAAMLAYLAWWITGILFYMVERENPHVRFHASQSIVAFGGISAIVLALMAGGGVALFVSETGFQILMTLSQLVMLAGVIVWLVCLFKAFGGERFQLPIAGALAERLAER